jgi:cation:H+ antiporter
MVNALLLAVGLALLTTGAEVLIRGALAAARRFHVSPLLSGLVIVGFGTSLPELVVSVSAALRSMPGIAIGNVVGSNIANILLILGVCALIAPLAVPRSALGRDAVTAVAVSALFVVVVTGKVLGRPAAVLFLLLLAAHLAWAYWTERTSTAPGPGTEQIPPADERGGPRPMWWVAGAVSVGLLLLVGGSRVLLVGAVGLAGLLGISETVVGLTLVAVGTSLPELSVSILAALRRQADVAIGNVLGSNVFNVLGILGLSALLQPLSIHPRIVRLDQWVMLGASLVLLVFLFTGRRLSRIEGAILLAGYGLYIGLGFTLFPG